MGGILGLLYSKPMSSLNLKTLRLYQVQNVDPTVTAAELETYFSYCGTVDKIQLQRNKDESQSAQVTFRAPFAFRTALLLDNAMVARQPIRVSPLDDSTTDVRSIMLEGDTKDDLRPNEAVTAGGTTNILDRTGDKLEGKYKLSEKGRVLVDQTRMAIHTAEKAAERFGSLITKNPYVAPTLMFLSGALYKAAMYASQVRARKRN